jgi:Holliday junction resolvase RusA-like endonuclease|tara:strand:- start:2005 stop:2460 length:456 start_codon:yes stop_codon:yes gene_type:complete
MFYEYDNQKTKKPDITKLEFVLYCNPPKTTKQASLRFAKGRCYHVKSANDNYKQLHDLVYPFRPLRPFDEPLTLKVKWVYPWRKSQSKKSKLEGMIPCDTRPDCDNIYKGFCDILQEAKYFKDDAQICSMAFEKWWGDVPRIEVCLRPFRG